MLEHTCENLIKTGEAEEQKAKDCPYQFTQRQEKRRERGLTELSP